MKQPVSNEQRKPLFSLFWDAGQQDRESEELADQVMAAAAELWFL